MARTTYLLCILSLFATAARAEAVYYPSKVETSDWLLNNQFAQLDQQYGAIQDAYRRGEISDVELRNAFRTFYPTDARYVEPYRAWVAHSPKSYVAHLARAIYYKFVGLEQRGTNYASNTSEEKMQAMRDSMRIAQQELTASLALERKPVLSYINAIEIESLSGNIDAARELLDHALALDPKSSVARVVYMGAIRTEWGGSTAMMKAFLEECRTAGLGAEHMKGLESLVLQDEGLMQSRQGDNKAALQSYSRAAQLAPEQACAPCGPLIKAVDSAIADKQFAKAESLCSQALEINPDFLDALNARGYSRLQMGQGRLAETDYRKGAQLGNAHSQKTLAKMLLIGLSIPMDREQGIAWMKKAADQGDEEAIKLLPIIQDPKRRLMPMPGEKL